MNKRKIVTLAVTLCMIAILAVGGTLAYFVDTDSAKNVMTLGGVDIMQNEKEFKVDENGEKTSEQQDFTQDKPLMPMVNNIPEGGKTVVDGYFNPAMENVVDKIVTVTNEADADSVNKDAYVRTILAFETNKVYDAGTDTVIGDAHDMYIGVLGDFDYVMDGEEFVTITVDNVEYVLAVKVYEEALAPAATTEPSLKQVFLAPTAGNEVSDLFGSEYTILALSQGTQTIGFNSAEEALNEAFGEVSAANKAAVQAWFEAI